MGDSMDNNKWVIIEIHKDFSPVSYRFFQFIDELLHYTGIGYGTKWARRFCNWSNRNLK